MSDINTPIEVSVQHIELIKGSAGTRAWYKVGKSNYPTVMFMGVAFDIDTTDPESYYQPLTGATAKRLLPFIKNSAVLVCTKQKFIDQLLHRMSCAPTFFKDLTQKLSECDLALDPDLNAEQMSECANNAMEQLWGQVIVVALDQHHELVVSYAGASDLIDETPTGPFWRKNHYWYHR